MSGQAALTQLLDQVTAILELRKKRQPVPGENFNVFSVMNMETREVDTHCRLLYELLSPNGSHGLGDCLLQAFFETVLDKPYPGNGAVSVYREYVIDHRDDNYGRIDLLLRGQGFCYPIEVKVLAGDQWEQVKRYAKFASDEQGGQVYYLTLHGIAPSEDSLGGIDVSDVVCLSFANDISRWLKRCGELAWNAPSVAEVIRQYIHLLNKLTGNSIGDVFMDQIKETIRMSQANFESAYEISKAVASVRADMMRQVFQEIKVHFTQMENPLEIVYSDYAQKAMSYCQNVRGGSSPSLSYRLAERGGYTLVLCFEIDWNLYWGLALLQEGQYVAWPKDLTLFADAFPDLRWESCIKHTKPMTSWDYWWRYLPDGRTSLVPGQMINFHDCSGRYMELFDPEKHKTLMKEIFEEIDQHIDTIRSTGLYD